MKKTNTLIIPNSEEVNKKLLEFKDYLDKLNLTLKNNTYSEVKKCTKRCIEVINIAGELDDLFGKRR